MSSQVKKVFILDDAQVFLMSYQAYLKHFNLRDVEFCLLTTSWNELLEHHQLKDANLILVDFSLGESVNGFDVAKECRNIAPNAKIKILTASVKQAVSKWKENPTYLSLCDISDIVEKPVTLKIFDELVSSLG